MSKAGVMITRTGVEIAHPSCGIGRRSAGLALERAPGAVICIS
jgi:hypothetical protein